MKSLGLDVQLVRDAHYRIRVSEDQVPEFCLGLVMIERDTIDVLEISSLTSLRFRQLSSKLSKKWNVKSGYAIQTQTAVDLYLCEDFLNGLIDFYLNYWHSGVHIPVDHADYFFYAPPRHPSASNLSITFSGAGYATHDS